MYNTIFYRYKSILVYSIHTTIQGVSYVFVRGVFLTIIDW